MEIAVGPPGRAGFDVVGGAVALWAEPAGGRLWDGTVARPGTGEVLRRGRVDLDAAGARAGLVAAAVGWPQAGAAAEGAFNLAVDDGPARGLYVADGRGRRRQLTNFVVRLTEGRVEGDGAAAKVADLEAELQRTELVAASTSTPLRRLVRRPRAAAGDRRESSA